MNALGHNNPPPLDAMSMHVEDLFALVSGTLAAGPIKNDEQEAALDGLLDDMRSAKKDAETQCDVEYRPHKTAADAVKAAWKPVLARCDVGVVEIKKALTPYREARQRAKDEAARLAREEAEAKQRAAQEAFRKSDDIEERFAAEEQLKQAAKLNASANRIDREATGLRTYWEAAIVDRREALNHYLKRNPEAFAELIQRLADQDARGTRAPVPGVVFHERKKAA